MSDPTAGTGRSADVRRMTFDDNALLAVLYGNHDRNLVRIEAARQRADQRARQPALDRRRGGRGGPGAEGARQASMSG